MADGSNFVGIERETFPAVEQAALKILIKVGKTATTASQLRLRDFRQDGGLGTRAAATARKCAQAFLRRVRLFRGRH
jgi:hypothetical protein